MPPDNEEQKSLCKVSLVGVRVTLWILSFAGFVLSCLAVSSCRFIKRATYRAGSVPSISFFGVYNFQSSYICVSSSLLSSLPDSEGASSSLKAARSFGVLAAVLGGVTTIWILISIFFTGTNRPLWITMASLLVASTIFQLIIFIAFNDDNCKDEHDNASNVHTFVDCSIDEGSAFAISAALFYLLTSIGMFLVAHPRVPLLRFEEGWRAGSAGGNGSNNGKVTHQAHTPVVIHQEQEQAPYSSTSPPMEPYYHNANLLHTGASVSPGAVDVHETSGTMPSVDVDDKDNFGVEL